MKRNIHFSTFNYLLSNIVDMCVRPVIKFGAIFLTLTNYLSLLCSNEKKITIQDQHKSHMRKFC